MRGSQKYIRSGFAPSANFVIFKVCVWYGTILITHTYFTYITKAGRAVVMRNHDGKVLQFTNTI